MICGTSNGKRSYAICLRPPRQKPTVTQSICTVNSRPANWPRLVNVGSAALHNSACSAGDSEKRGGSPWVRRADPDRAVDDKQGTTGSPGPKVRAGWGTTAWPVLRPASNQEMGGLLGLPGKQGACYGPSPPNPTNLDWEDDHEVIVAPT